MDSIAKDMKKRIDLKQKELKGLSDDKIRQMHLEIYDSARKSKKEIDAFFLAAIKKEVQRRWQATSWIWKRKSHAEDYEKWNAHHTKVERQATQWAIDKLSHNRDPESQETVKRLKNYLETL